MGNGVIWKALISGTFAILTKFTYTAYTVPERGDLPFQGLEGWQVMQFSGEQSNMGHVDKSPATSVHRSPSGVPGAERHLCLRQ